DQYHRLFHRYCFGNDNAKSGKRNCAWHVKCNGSHTNAHGNATGKRNACAIAYTSSNSYARAICNTNTHKNARANRYANTISTGI
ncbi:hypothetical protein C5S36_04115, partial [Candidatus Methanophagaceae archaeon]